VAAANSPARAGAGVLVVSGADNCSYGDHEQLYAYSTVFSEDRREYEDGASREALQKAAGELQAMQRKDGGWSQLPAMPSDA
jgi:hypothetical protein